MKIIKNTWFPFGQYGTINLFGILFTKKDNLSERTLNHEAIHSAQMKEMLYIPFYLWYGIEYIIIGVHDMIAGWRAQNTRYHDVSFEEEAFANQDDPEYLKNRKRFAWWKYLKLGSNK